jgi:glycosyltransferase involved in cell wall biosynthesis
MLKGRPRVLFIGAFDTSNPNVRGGQLQACTSLLRSSFSRTLDLVLLDSTQVSVPPPGLAVRSRRALARICRVARLLLFSRIDALLVFCADGASFIEKGLITVLARALGKRVVLAPRSGYLVDDFERSAIWRWIIGFVLQASSVVICQGRTWKDFFVRAGADPNRCRIVKNWVTSEDFSQIPMTAVPSGELQVLYLGWIEKAKGVFDLIAAIDEVQRSGRSVRAVLAGSGTAMAAIADDLAHRVLPGTVRLFGWANEAQRRALLASCNVLVMPSYREGLPNVVLEAMASGRAVIATRVGAVPDVIDDGTNGLLVDAGDVVGLAGALARLCDDPRLIERLCTNARRTILAEHDLETAAAALRAALVGNEGSAPSCS